MALVVGGIDFDYCDVEWFALVTNRDHSIIFEIALKYCISDSFVDYEEQTHEKMLNITH